MNRRALVAALLIAACGGTTPRTTVPAPPGAPVADRLPADPAQPAATPAAPSGPATKVRSIEGITEYTLPNGLTVLLFPDASQSTVTVNITYLVGSRHEGYGETGMAHLLEHMMFKGTAKHRNVLKLLEARGGHLNGTTWMDRTNYYETLPASQENLEFALALEADRMVNATISPDDLKTEFSVVRNEFEIGENQPTSVLMERITSTAYLWHNYGKSTIGSRADIERVPVPALRAFYEKYYQPDNAILVVSGKYDEAAALATIQRTFGGIARPTRQLAKTYTVEPQQDGERTVTLRRNGDIHVIGALYHTVGAASTDFAPASAAIDALTREPSGKLYKLLVETKLASSLYSFQWPTRDPGFVYFGAEVRDAKNVDKVERILFTEIEKLGAAPVDAKAIERWRDAELKDLELAFTDSQRIAIELSEYAAMGDWRLLFAMRDRVKNVTGTDAQRVAAQYFKTSNRTSGRFIPSKTIDRAPLTETPDIAEAIKGVKEVDSAVAQGEVFDASLPNIEARTQRKDLKGGIKAAYVAKATRGGKVQLSLAFHWGNEKALQNKATIAQLTAAVMTRGTAKKTYQDIQDLQNKLKARIWFSGGATGFTLNIETLKDQLPAALDLAGEMMATPTFPDKELELVRQELLGALEQQLSDPQQTAFTTMFQLVNKWPKSDPRYTMSPAEMIAAVKQVKTADLRAFHRDFVGAGKGELVVVGDFDAAAIGTQVEKLFGNTVSKQKYERLVDKAFGVPGQKKTIDIKDKEMATIIGGHDVKMKDTNPDYPAWILLGQILGGDLGSRLWMRLREAEGLSYGVGSWTTADALDDSGSIVFYAMVAPANLNKAKSSLLEELGKLTTGTFSAEELQRAKDSWTKSQDTSLSDDGYVVQMLSNHLFLGRTTAWTLDLRAKVQAVTPADVERVAKKYLALDRLLMIDAGDQAKAVVK